MRGGPGGRIPPHPTASRRIPPHPASLRRGRGRAGSAGRWLDGAAAPGMRLEGAAGHSPPFPSLPKLSFRIVFMKINGGNEEISL